MKPYSENALRNLVRLTQMICFGFLAIHFYKECYWLFDHWHFSSRLTDRVFYHIQDTPLLESLTCKSIALLFMALSLITTSVNKQQEISHLKCLIQILAGSLFYFSSQLLFARNGSPTTTCLSYILITTGGFISVVAGLSGLLANFRLSWDPNDPFGRKKMGFPQEQRKLTSSFGLNLPARFTWLGQQKDSWINLVNPRRGILIMGSPGSGKSYFIIESLIRQWMEKGNVLFLYDFKSPGLTRLVWYYFQLYRNRFPPRTAFCCINFRDLPHSHRCNVLSPSTLESLSDALGASRTILLSINKTWVNKQGEFFVESPINFLGALIWYLRQYSHGLFCTLPHVIELAQLPYKELFPILSTNNEILTLISPFAQAFENKTFELLDSQISSARIPLGRLASPELYYILTGDDLSLDINNPSVPTILCLGGYPSRQDAIAPVLSLYIDQINKLCNQPNRLPCALICDEFATVRAYSMGNTIATARSNDIVPIIAIQDLSQLRTQYSRDEADLFLNITGNLLCGQVGGDTARWVSERFPKIQQPRESVSTNSNDTSVSVSPQWEPTITTATIAGLSSGEFVGITADEPGQEMELKTFHAKILREKVPATDIHPPLPFVREVTHAIILQNFKQVKRDIAHLAADEERKMQEQAVP